MTSILRVKSGTTNPVQTTLPLLGSSCGSNLIRLCPKAKPSTVLVSELSTGKSEVIFCFVSYDEDTGGDKDEDDNGDDNKDEWQLLNLPADSSTN